MWPKEKTNWLSCVYCHQPPPGGVIVVPHGSITQDWRSFMMQSVFQQVLFIAPCITQSFGCQFMSGFYIIYYFTSNKLISEATPHDDDKPYNLTMWFGHAYHMTHTRCYIMWASIKISITGPPLLKHCILVNKTTTKIHFYNWRCNKKGIVKSFSMMIWLFILSLLPLVHHCQIIIISLLCVMWSTVSNQCPLSPMWYIAYMLLFLCVRLLVGPTGFEIIILELVLI